jgi:hypothetical protein
VVRQMQASINMQQGMASLRYSVIVRGDKGQDGRRISQPGVSTTQRDCRSNKP